VQELGITRAEALTILQVLWLQHVVELFGADDFDEEEQGEEWKRAT